MRQRHDYYTICPECESRVPLTHAARLQAGRHGASCVCPASHCRHEWICIQEWIYRDAIVAPRAMVAPQQQAPMTTQIQPAGAAPPRPHLPTFQPPQQMPGVTPSAGAAPQSQVPAPHAWSWERVSEGQHVAPPDHNAFGS